jgi:hypothetical protein
LDAVNVYLFDVKKFTCPECFVPRQARIDGVPFEESCVAASIEKYVGKIILMKPRVRHKRHCLHIGDGETGLEVV